MSDLVHQRVLGHCKRLQLTNTALRVDALLEKAAKDDLTFLDFLDLVTSEEVASKSEKRVRMGIQIAHFPV